MTALVIADHDNKTLNDATAKTVTAAAAVSTPVHILVAGENCAAVADAAAKIAGVEKVLLADNALYARMLAEPMETLILSVAEAYDAILAMDAAAKDVKGDVKNKEAVLKALKAANFQSIRGPFKYDTNNFPIQDYYLRVIGKDSEGRITNKTLSTPLKGYRDAYHTQCKMK